VAARNFGITPMIGQNEDSAEVSQSAIFADRTGKPANPQGLAKSITITNPAKQAPKPRFTRMSTGRPPPNLGGYGPFQPYACQAPNGWLSGNLWTTRGVCTWMGGGLGRTTTAEPAAYIETGSCCIASAAHHLAVVGC
jgi:hypothetical protein